MRGTFATTARGLVAFAAVVSAGGAASGQPDKVPLALAGLEPGRWQILDPDHPRAKPRFICIGDPTVLIQLEHHDIICSRLVITNEAQRLAVHYVCPFNGFGQTSLRVETPRLVRLDTQGIVANAPFAYRAEARRLGPCAPEAPLARR